VHRNTFLLLDSLKIWQITWCTGTPFVLVQCKEGLIFGHESANHTNFIYKLLFFQSYQTKHCTDLCVRTPVQNNILDRSLDSYPGHKSTQISLQLNVSLLPILILYKCSCSLSFANLEIQFLPVLRISSSIRQLRLQKEVSTRRVNSWTSSIWTRLTGRTQSFGATYIIVRRALFCKFFLVGLFLDLLLDPLEASRGATL
jgi:hypothetical protein